MIFIEVSNEHLIMLNVYYSFCFIDSVLFFDEW